MLIRPKETACHPPVQDTSELSDTIQTLMDAIKLGMDSRIMTQLARKALTVSKNTEWRIRELSIKNAMLELDAVTDSLTGILNRRGFDAALHRALAEGRRYDEDGALLLLDLDGFKLINDTLGHSAGDAVLQKVADILSSNVRDSDCVGRIGGDEFAVLMGRTSVEDAAIRAASIEWKINTAGIDWHGQPVSILASMGTDYFGPKDESSVIILRADQAMYNQKQGRRKSFIPASGLGGAVIPIALSTEPGSVKSILAKQAG